MVNIKTFALLAGAVLPTLGRPSGKRDEPQSTAGKFIVTLKPGITASSHLRSQRLSAASGSAVDKVFSIASYQAYSGTFNEESIAQISQSDEVASVEPVQVFSINALTTQTSATWGLGAISHRTKGPSDYVYDTTAGEGMYAYTLDTGVNPAHVEFEGRAVFGYNAYPGTVNEDRHGHGTHVAGTILGKTYGVAKKAELIAVKATNDAGSTTTEVVLDAIQWAVNNITAEGRKATSVINMSLGGPFSEAWNAAIAAAYQANILTVVAAGNNAKNASLYSPSSAPDAITVAAIGQDYTQSWFSNFGQSVDIFAAGGAVLSANIGPNNNETSYRDGTSMAAPHVAGLALYLKALLKTLTTPALTTAKIKELGTKGVVGGLEATTVNLLAYNGNGA